MNDYIKQLEASNEELQARLAKLEGGYRFDKPRPRFVYAYLIKFNDGRYKHPWISRNTAHLLVKNHKIPSIDMLASKYQDHIYYLIYQHGRLEKHVDISTIVSIHIRVGIEHQHPLYLDPTIQKTDIPLFIRSNLPPEPKWYTMPWIWYKRLCDGYYWDFKNTYEKKGRKKIAK